MNNMNHCFSTFTTIDNYENQYASAIVRDLNLQTSTFNIHKQNDNCDEYYDFL